MADELKAGEKPAPVAIVAPDPVPVAIVTPAPVPVDIVSLPPEIVAAATSVKKGEAVQSQETNPSKPANTTFQQDLTLAGQRNINAMWEGTQRNLALIVTAGALMMCGYLVGFGTPELQLLAFTLVSNVCILVVGTYFQRTNHTKTGGVGSGETGR